MPDLPSGTVSFLFTDIERSTRLWENHAEAMPAAYARHDAIIREACASYGGTVYKTVGDALQVAFSTAPAAVSAAAAAQRLLQEEHWPLPEPLQVRMALHTGAVEPLAEGDYRSPVLNRLGRLLAAGHGGQVLLSHATTALCRDHLPPGIELIDLGEQRLRDLDRPERVAQLSGATLRVAFPPLRTLDARPNNLPAQPNPLVGRTAELAQLRSLLTSGETRLVTLTGPGGIGKTRLAMHAAADLLDAFPDGAFVVELAPLTDPALVPGAIVQALGVAEEPAQPTVGNLIGYLRDRRLLLVLDNVEHLVDAAPVVGELLAACPQLVVLATSRVRLALRWERTFAVNPLEVPESGQVSSPESLSQYESVRLFIDRAVAVRPEFTVNNRNAPAVAAICVRLEGLPLAIELAAARIALLPPEAMLRRLDQRLPLLTGGYRDLPARQRTLHGAIAWSYELLSAGEQALFRRLAVFAGGATLEAIESVAADSVDQDVMTGVEALVDHSLLRRVDIPGETRFTMLETIREYAWRQLKATGEDGEIRERHAAFHASLAATASPELDGPDQGTWLDRLEREHDNLRGTLEWLLASDPERALQLAADVWWLWLVRGYLREGMTWLDRALAASAPDASLARVRVLNGACALASELADPEQGRRYGEESLALSRELGDPVRIASALHNLGNSLFEDDPDRSRSLLEESLAISRREGLISFSASASLNLGNLALRDDLDAALEYYTDALEDARTAGHSFLECTALVDLAQIALYRREDVLTAARQLQGALDIAEAIGQVGGMRGCLESASGMCALLGKPARSARFHGATMSIDDQAGTTYGVPTGDSFEELLATVRAELGEEAFAEAVAAGAALTLEQAIEEAQSFFAEVAAGLATDEGSP